MKNTLLGPQEQVAKWNEQVPEGELVNYRTEPGGEIKQGKAMGASTMHVLTAFVWIKGLKRAVPLELCELAKKDAGQ